MLGHLGFVLGLPLLLRFSSVQLSRSVFSDPLRPHESQHARPPCPSSIPGVYSNSCPLSQWCHNHPFLLLSIFPSIRLFSSESALRIRWPKYWSFSFSISPPSEHSGLISYRMDWLDLLAVHGTLKSLLQHHSSKASILQHSSFFTVQSLSHITMWYLSAFTFDELFCICSEVSSCCLALFLRSVSW